MAKKKVTRKELLKSPDEFMTFSEKAVLFFSAHRRHLEYFGYALLAAAVIYLGVHTFFRYINKKGQEAYNAAHSAVTENMRGKLDPQKLQNAGELFSKVIDEHGLSKVARLAVPQLAWTKFLEKQYDEAIVLYEKFLDKISEDPLYESLTRLALAACYEAKGEFKTAIENIETLSKTPDNPFRETAMLSIARLYRLDNQPEKAKEILKQFVETYEDSPFLPMAKALM